MEIPMSRAAYVIKAGRGGPRRQVGIVGAVWLLATVVTALPANASPNPPDFYTLPARTIGRPGSLIRQEALPEKVEGGHAYRILYESSGVRGEPIVVSGIAVIPDSVAEPGGRPVVAWGHPTTGVAQQCAPSLARSSLSEIQGLSALVSRGYIVVATDYPGLGAPGIHPYLVGISEGRAILDSVRVAAKLPGANASPRFALWGHSQGGQAVLFAAQISAVYAAELHLVGVAAAAPATALDTLLRDDANSDGGRNITAMTLWSWHRVFGVPLDGVVEPAAVPVLNRLANSCIETAVELVERKVEGSSLARDFLSVPDISAVEPWGRLLRENIPSSPPRNTPVLIVQGLADTLVRPSVTAAYGRRLCADGIQLQWLWLPKVGHGFIARDSAPAVVEWVSNRFDGTPAPDQCALR